MPRVDEEHDKMGLVRLAIMDGVVGAGSVPHRWHLPGCVVQGLAATLESFTTTVTSAARSSSDPLQPPTSAK
jgi:hypothetical protein